MPPRGSDRSSGIGFRAVWWLLSDAFSDWMEDRAPRLGAALAYYTALSIAPLLLIAIGMAGLVFGEEAARGQIVGQLQGLVGDEGARAIQDMIANAQKPAQGIVATLVGVVTLLAGASGVFGQLQDALNTIWEVAPRPGRGWRGLVRDRFLSLSMVLGTGFLLLVSLLVSAGAAAAGEALGGLTPGFETAAHAATALVSFGVVTALFAMIFKYLPDAEIAWRDVWAGAAITAGLFVVGKFAIGLYLGHASIGSAYGAAGSFVVLLVWVYYSAQVLLFGAELTQATPPVVAAAWSLRRRPCASSRRPRLAENAPLEPSMRQHGRCGPARGAHWHRLCLFVVTRSAVSLAALAIMLAGAPSDAIDNPLRGQYLHLCSNPGAGKSRIRFGATGELADERARSGADPRMTGAFLEVIGDGILGADAPPVPLPASTWRALGDPPGSRGYRYFDASARFGVRKAALRFGAVTSLSATGGGAAWPYRTSGVPGAVMVRLSIGDDVYCAAFETFERRRRGTMVARYNSPPVSCTNDAAGR